VVVNGTGFFEIPFCDPVQKACRSPALSRKIMDGESVGFDQCDM